MISIQTIKVLLYIQMDSHAKLKKKCVVSDLDLYSLLNMIYPGKKKSPMKASINLQIQEVQTSYRWILEVLLYFSNQSLLFPIQSFAIYLHNTCKLAREQST